jgi:hypothetical protein
MAFTLGADETGRSCVILVDAPDYVTSLRIAPPFLENQVKEGKWLIVSMSVWSVDDIRAGHRAIQMVQRHGGLVKLGLRPFDFAKENATWVPGLRSDQTVDQVGIFVSDHDPGREVKIQGMPGTSPVWMAIVEGNVIGLRFGQLTDAEILDLISRLVSFAD